MFTNQFLAQYRSELVQECKIARLAKFGLCNQLRLWLFATTSWSSWLLKVQYDVMPMRIQVQAWKSSLQLLPKEILGSRLVIRASSTYSHDTIVTHGRSYGIDAFSCDQFRVFRIPSP